MNLAHHLDDAWIGRLRSQLSFESGVDNVRLNECAANQIQFNECDRIAFVRVSAVIATASIVW